MHGPISADATVSDPADTATGDQEEALIRAAAAEILRAAEAEPIPEHLRELAVDLAGALQKRLQQGLIEASEEGERD